MTLVNIIKNWQGKVIIRQTPDCSGVWNDIRFSIDGSSPCDYIVILNWVSQERTIECYPGHVWAVIQEPPHPPYEIIHRGQPSFSRIYTQDRSLTGSRYIHRHGALAWHVKRDYNTLKSCLPPEKTGRLSWITSNLAVHPGHRKRLDFLRNLEKTVDFDLWGRGFSPIDDKWDGLAPYQYSLAIENYQGEHYWSEKIADCWLSWSMPIYYGCTNLEDYFPPESFVRIDIQDPDAPRLVTEIIQSDLWLRNREAIAHARQLVLDHYQLFPYLAKEIHDHQQNDCDPTNSDHHTISSVHLKMGQLPNLSLRQRLPIYWYRLLSKILPINHT